MVCSFPSHAVDACGSASWTSRSNCFIRETDRSWKSTQQSLSRFPPKTGNYFNKYLVLRPFSKNHSLRDFSRLLGISHHQVRGVLSQLTALQTHGTFDKHFTPPAFPCFRTSFVGSGSTINREADAGNQFISILKRHMNPQLRGVWDFWMISSHRSEEGNGTSFSIVEPTSR